ncbi:MAG: hypothetical protein AAGL89_09130 [Pseudomonadota bacterium]
MSEALESWKLENFIDSLVLELDKARDTLSLKGITRKLSYAVQDVNFDLHVFPDFDDGNLRFRVARPGDEGASRIAFQLGSITDRQINETSVDPVTADDIAIEEIEGLEPEIKSELKKVGVTSTRDLARLESRNVDLGAVVERKTGSKAAVNYADLANKITSARRDRNRPTVQSMSVEPRDAGRVSVVLTGANLAPVTQEAGFPRATVNDIDVEVSEATDDRLVVTVAHGDLNPGSNPLALSLDPFSELTVDLARGRLS